MLLMSSESFFNYCCFEMIKKLFCHELVSENAFGLFVKSSLSWPKMLPYKLRGRSFSLIQKFGISILSVIYMKVCKSLNCCSGLFVWTFFVSPMTNLPTLAIKRSTKTSSRFIFKGIERIFRLWRPSAEMHSIVNPINWSKACWSLQASISMYTSCSTNCSFYSSRLYHLISNSGDQILLSVKGNCITSWPL